MRKKRVIFKLIGVAMLVLILSLGILMITDEGYEVNLMQEPDVGATLTGEGKYEEGDIVKLEATGWEEAYFEEWSSEDITIDNIGSATDASFKMPNEDVTITANFGDEFSIEFDDEAPTPVGSTLMQIELIEVDNPQDYEIKFKGEEMEFDEYYGKHGGFYIIVDEEVKDRAEDEIIEDLE